MTTPSPNTTPQPDSPEDAKGELKDNIDAVTKEQEKETLETVDAAAEYETEQVKALPDEARASARAKLSKVGSRELGKVEADLKAAADEDELKMDSMREAAKGTATQNAAEVTEAAEKVADTKAQSVVGSLMHGTNMEIEQAEHRANEMAKEAKDMVHEANVAAERVENAAKEARLAAMKDPAERSAEAKRLAIKAGEHVVEMQPQALQAMNMAEAAAAVAWEAQKMANKALKDSKLAVQASQSAYNDALINKANLVKLKEKAKQASKEVKMAANSAMASEQQAMGAFDEARKLRVVT